jgi:hypothetical protein
MNILSGNSASAALGAALVAALLSRDQTPPDTRRARFAPGRGRGGAAPALPPPAAPAPGIAIDPATHTAPGVQMRFAVGGVQLARTVQNVIESSLTFCLPNRTIAPATPPAGP